MNSDARPINAGLIGWPVWQAKSPLIHAHWLEKTGIDGHYIRLPVRPGAVEAAFRGMVDLGFAGLQATMPHKRDCFRAVDRLTDTARSLGAVNTVVVEKDGSLLGHNTDIGGFLEPLTNTSLSGQAVTILGAGGAAAAITVGLAGKGVSRIHLINRSAAGIEALLRDIGPALEKADLVTGDWSDAARLARESALVVNTTSLGMVGAPTLPLDPEGFAAGTIVYDIVTHPHDTPLLKAARAAGLPTFDGFDMLIGQAREAFELFFGMKAPAEYDADIKARLAR